MTKITILFAATVLLLTFGCSPKTTAAATGADGTDYAALAASYRQNPEALRQFVESCEATDDELTATRRQLEEMRRSSSTVGQDAAALRDNLQRAQVENDQLRQQLVDIQNQTSDRLDTDNQQIVPGVIFQVQLGAYAQNTVNPDLSTGNALELQDQGGVQKVVVSQFRTYTNAAKLRDRLKQMGVSDAFVVAKNNGQRITVPEALRIAGQN